METNKSATPLTTQEQLENEQIRKLNAEIASIIKKISGGGKRRTRRRKTRRV